MSDNKSRDISARHREGDEHDNNDINPSDMRAEEGPQRVDDSLEYQFIQTEELDRDTRIPVPLPAENFQGTWEGALNEGKKAYKDVAAASSTYYKSLASSNLPKAAFSLGGAIAGTANRTALNAADYAVKATGSDRSRLPPILGNWLKGKDKLDEVKKRKEEAEKARHMRKWKQELIAAGEVVDNNPSQPGSRASSFRGPSSYGTPHSGPSSEKQGGSTSKSSPPSEPVRSYLHAKSIGSIQSQLSAFSLAEDSDEEDKSMSQTKTFAHSTMINNAFETPGAVRHKLKAPLLGENKMKTATGEQRTPPHDIASTDRVTFTTPSRSVRQPTYSEKDSPYLAPSSEDDEQTHSPSHGYSDHRESLLSSPQSTLEHRSHVDDGNGFQKETLSVPGEESAEMKTPVDEGEDSGDDESAVGLAAMLE